MRAPSPSQEPPPAREPAQEPSPTLAPPQPEVPSQTDAPTGTDQPAVLAPEPVPPNRAARRGGKKAPSGAVHAGPAGHSRPAQGRRIIPVRRTG